MWIILMITSSECLFSAECRDQKHVKGYTCLLEEMNKLHYEPITLLVCLKRASDSRHFRFLQSSAQNRFIAVFFKLSSI